MTFQNVHTNQYRGLDPEYTERLRAALAESEGVIKTAARILGLTGANSGNGLAKTLRRHGLNWREFRERMCVCRGAHECQVCRDRSNESRRRRRAVLRAKGIKQKSYYVKKGLWRGPRAEPIDKVELLMALASKARVPQRIHA